MGGGVGWGVRWGGRLRGPARRQAGREAGRHRLQRASLRCMVPSLLFHLGSRSHPGCAAHPTRPPPLPHCLRRSQRSLARNALRNSNYAKAAQHWETALALNPLHGEGWFRWGGELRPGRMRACSPLQHAAW